MNQKKGAAVKRRSRAGHVSERRLFDLTVRTSRPTIYPMIRITRISTFTDRGAESASHVWRTVSSQPSWVTRAALLTFLIVIGLPILLLFLLALLVATIVFSALALVYSVYARIRSALPRSDGRDNVIVRRVE